MSAWGIYLILKLDSIREVCGVTTVLLFATLFIIGLFSTEIVISRKTTIVLISIIITAMICLGSVGVFLPSTKQMCAIVVIPKVADAINSNEKLKELPNNILDLANEWIKELTPNKEKLEK